MEQINLSNTYNPLPGVSTLGRCINIFQAYDTPNGQQLFNINSGDRTYEWSGVTYFLPDNVSWPQIVQAGEGRAEYFSSQQEFSAFFEEKASINGQYKAFSAQFSEEYSVNSQTQSQYSYGFFHVEYDGYQVTVDIGSPDKLRLEVKNDALYTSVPSLYTEDNKMEFFRFFSRYGTHYVQSIVCGGRLYFYSGIEKSYNFTDSEIKAELKATYDALFIKAEGDVSARWQQVNKNWFTSQNGNIQIRGGDRAILSSVVPAWGEDLTDIYDEWLGSLGMDPAPRDFTFRPISDIFPVEKQLAVAKALEEYANSHLTLEVTGGNSPQACACYIAINGKPLQPDLEHRNTGGMLIAVFDRKTLKLLFHRSYDVQKNRRNQQAGNNWIPDAEAAYIDAVADIQPYQGSAEVIVALLYWGVNSLYSYPPISFSSFMTSLGAGDDLSHWLSYKTSGTASEMAYALVGIPDGSHPGIESLIRGSVTWDIEPEIYPSLKLDIFLEPEATADGVQFLPR